MLIAQTEAEELPTVTVNPYFSFGPVSKAVSEMKQHLNEFGNDELVKVAKTSEGTLASKHHCFTVNMCWGFYILFLQLTKWHFASWRT